MFKYLLVPIALISVIATTMQPASACPHNPKAKAAFVKTHPCPSTGKTYGACKGYVVDHVKALCVGGQDKPSNMQWQTTADAKAKDKVECKKP